MISRAGSVGSIGSIGGSLGSFGSFDSSSSTTTEQLVGGGDDDGVFESLMAAFRAFQKVGKYIQTTWVGEAMRRTPGFVMVAVLVYTSALSAYIVVQLRMKMVKSSSIPTWMQDVLAPDTVFAGAYAACVIVIAIVCIGLILWPWASGIVPSAGMFGAFASIGGVFVSVMFDRVLRVADSAKVTLPSDLLTRTMYLHSTIGLILAMVVASIPSTSPYDTDAAIAKSMMQGRQDAKDAA
jgi:hypothetical protein